MPELAELKIMSDYINQNSKDKVFTKAFHVEKGNNPVEFKLLDKFYVNAESFGKELKVKLSHDGVSFYISVFMGMSGNWKWVRTENWNDTKFVRMRAALKLWMESERGLAHGRITVG